MQSNISKSDLRIQLNSLLNKSNSIDVETFEQKTLAEIKTLQKYIDASLLLAYYPMQKEASCLRIIKDSLTNKSVAIPKIHKNTMTFHSCKDIENKNNFIKNSYGIYEPYTEAIHFDEYFNNNADILILVPGLAFSKDGKRLGRGKAYYDRFLYQLHSLQKNYIHSTTITTVGLCFAIQVVDYIPTDVHDITMDYVLTECGFQS